MKKIRVVQWGLGAMGSGMARLMLEKEGMEIVGAVDLRPDYEGKDLGDVLNVGRKLGVTVARDPKGLLDKAKADVCVQAINSFTKECMPEMKLVIESGLHLVTIAEEMAAPDAQQPELARQLDDLAKKNGVAVLGTGINPGFVLDGLVVFLSAACLRVDRIEAARINDLSPFGPTVMKTQGVGTTPEQFEAGIKTGEIVGHIGFPESIRMISDAIGLGVDRIEQTRRPIISKVYRETPHVKVQPGMVAGCEHIGTGFRGDKEVIKLTHPQQIHPHMEGVKTGDYVTIFGEPEIHVVNSPEVPGGKGTMAVAVNSIPNVVRATPGLKRMTDLPIPSCLMGPSAYDRK
jgi:4-hydroxy-tetrahydrodipicolinate reductase